MAPTVKKPNHWILVDKIPTPVTDVLEWAKWFEKGNRHVAYTVLGVRTISTVFLGIDYSFGFGDPLLFETMIFGPDGDEYQERYCTYEEAEAGHKEAVELATRRYFNELEKKYKK